ncbi:putative proteasome component (PCI) domain-containing protein [Lupinus albus]|uniref:Putative proteasome component (PCI) domain-containing protein n=1 Tax=Lupinus albus TaxID=3870 RepID=A0A6A4P2A4_LUPAL|nr:putative proteasome component (PCI) domain-containing protein [Lupinus albus]
MEGDDENSGSMIDEIYANGDGGDNNRTRKPIFSGDQLDIEVYASLYVRRTKIMRLLFIADRCGEKNNTTMQLEALRMAYDEIKKGENTQLYREVVQKIDGRLGPDYDLDVAWAENVDRRAEQKKEKLENELNAYRTNLIKESIRMGYNDFGDFYYAHGQLGDAFKSYVRTRDYCTTSKHIIHMCMSAILVSIEMGQFSHVTSYVSKAEQAPESLDLITVSKLRCAAGLANLEAKKYKHAARKFLETSPDLGSHYNEVIAPQDVATYGGLCALATFDRTELKNKVIDNFNFRNFLELVPEVRELINDFYSSHYASCLEYLGNLKDNLLLDIHLHDHVETLYDQIRHKALIQYTHPFVSVDLNMMANAFKTTVAGLQKELEALITDNQIQARIDSHNKILYARHADQRKATFQRVLETGRVFDRNVRDMLLRSNLIKHEYNLRASSRKH